MNEQLQAQLATIIAQIAVSVGEAKDFSVAQLPEIANQYIQYGKWSSIFWSGISGLLILVFLGVMYSIHIAAQKSGESGVYMFWTLPTVGIIFITLGLVNNLHNLIMIHTAPKVWFLLEIKNLLS